MYYLLLVLCMLNSFYVGHCMNKGWWGVMSMNLAGAVATAAALATYI